MSSSQQGWAIRNKALVALLVLAGCSGEESDVRPQQPAARTEATGMISDGIQVRRQTVVGKGAMGLARTSESSSNGRYALSLTELTGPYLLANSLSPSGDPDLVLLTSVATRSGVINLTPLTTLLTAQVLGVAPGAAYTSFSSDGAGLSGRITDAGIVNAQSEVTRLLQDVFGVQVRSGQASFVETPFLPVAGDTMFDTIQALNARLATSGTTLSQLASDIAVSVRTCQTEQIATSAGGAQGRFCPLTKSALPDEADSSILDYVFRSIRHEELTVRVRANSVLGVEFKTTAGSSSSCAGSGCVGIVLGSPAADETQPIALSGLSLTGAAGSVVLTGNLIGAQPFVSIPNLPCADNRFIVIFDDHHAQGDCVSANDPLQIGGTFGGPLGPGREGWNFSNSSDPQPSFPHVEIGLDMTTATPTANYVYYSDVDPGTYQVRNSYACQLAACSGVTVGPHTVNNSAGFPIEVFNITLDSTVLTGMDENGAATGRNLSVRASFTALRDPSFTVSYPPQTSCLPPADTIEAVAFGATFNLCVPENDINNGVMGREQYDVGGGDLQIVLTSDGYDQLVFFLHNDELVEVRAQISSTGESYRCAGGCPGVTVTQPDGQGRRTVGFSAAVLYHVESFPRPGDRTLRLDGAGLVIPPP